MFKHLLFLLVLITSITTTNAETYKVYVGSGAGGPGDVITRRVFKQVEENSDNKFIIINKPGADFLVAYEAFLAESKTNPNVLFLSTNGTHVASYYVRPELKLDPMKDTKSLIGLVKMHFLFVSKNESNIRSLTDIRGKLNVGANSGTATMVLKSLKIDPEVQIVPYKSDADVVVAILADQLPAGLIISGNNLYNANRDKLRVAYQVNLDPVIGISVARNFSTDKQKELNLLLNKALKDPEVVDWFKQNIRAELLGGSPADYDKALLNFKKNLLGMQ